MKIYISGPITGMPNKNIEAFLEAAITLRLLGHEPINPHDIDTGKENPTWHDHMRADLKVLMECDAVARLPGWNNSRGARIEVNNAWQLEMPCFDIEEFMRDVKQSTECYGV